ncbi:MAG: hypothetical protein IJ389_02755 [Clostridia bacterium]|nr:hypothetical protein [Clostridia bacterium]
MKKTTGNLSRSRFSGRFGSLGGFIRYCRDAVVRAFDNSFISRVLVRMRETVPYIRNRVLGTFLLTFGIYSTLISVFKTVFEFGGSADNGFITVSLAIASVPLLISRGTVYTMLSTSRTGRVIGECIGIRLQAMGGSVAIGRENMAFLLGMLAGTLTFVFDPAYIIGMAAAVVVAALILTYPEATVIFAAVLLPMGIDEAFTYLAVVGIVSFIIKLIRRKRYLRFPSHIKAAVLFIGVVAFLGAATGNVNNALLALMCMMIAFSDRNGEKAKYASSVALSVCAVMTSVYLAFYAVAYLAGLKADLSVFDVETLSVMSAALVPVSVSRMISGEIMPGRTSFLCFVSTVAFLAVTRSYMCLAAAAVGMALLLFAYRRKLAYFFMSIAGVAYACWVWLGGSNRIAFDTFMGFLSEFNIDEKQGLSAVEIIYGEGLGRGVFSGDNFYDALISGVGLVGVAIFATALILLAVYIVKQKNKAAEDKEYGFLSAFAHYCSLLVLLVCGAQISIWEQESMFVMFWMMLASASAISLDEQTKANVTLYYTDKDEDGSIGEIVISFAQDK